MSSLSRRGQIIGVPTQVPVQPVSGVPLFPPVRVGGGRWPVWRAIRRRRRVLACCLALAAAALVAAVPRLLASPAPVVPHVGLAGVPAGRFGPGSDPGSGPGSDPGSGPPPVRAPGSPSRSP